MAERVAKDDEKKKKTGAKKTAANGVAAPTTDNEEDEVIARARAEAAKKTNKAADEARAAAWMKKMGLAPETEKVAETEKSAEQTPKKKWQPKVVRDKMIEMDLAKINWEDLDFQTVERVQAVLKENAEREKLREMRDDVREAAERKKERVAKRKLEREIAEGKVSPTLSASDRTAEADKAGESGVELPNGRKTKVLTKAEHKAEKKAYIERKRKIIEALEPKNRRKMVFFRATDGFWKIGGTSAVIFYRKVLPRVDKKARLRFAPDNDWDYLFEYGFCSVKNIDAYVKKILKYPGIRMIADTEDYKSFLLKYEITETEFQALVNQDEIMKKALMAKILKTQPMQNFYFGLMELIKVVNTLDMHHTERIVREIYVREIEKLLTDMLTVYIMMTKNGMPQKVAIEKERASLARISAIILEMDEVGGWTHKECGKVGDLVAEVERGMRR